THNAVQGEFLTRELDIIQVVGKQQPIRIYELIGENELDVPSNLMRSILFFEKGLKAYRSQNFESALRSFTAAQQMAEEDRPAQVFADRCRYFLEEAVMDGDWDGIWVMTEK
ncbi:MAG: hypothetical protein IH991_03125, partial [Planctomycetes bacterium]|nr:hypothetical protein [Planctomycetota bacterium]